MKTLAILAALVLTGCATGQKEYFEAESQRHAAEAARWAAMADIARSGDTTAKAVALAVMGNAPKSAPTAAPVNEALQWASVLVPGVTQVMGLRYNYLSQQAASNNAARVAESTNSTMSAIAGRIQAPVVAVPQANVATTTTTTTSTTDSHNSILSGTGTLGSGAYSTVDSHAVQQAPAIITPVDRVTPVVITPIDRVTPIVQVTPIQITPIAQPVAAVP